MSARKSYHPARLQLLAAQTQQIRAMQDKLTSLAAARKSAAKNHRGLPNHSFSTVSTCRFVFLYFC